MYLSPAVVSPSLGLASRDPIASSNSRTSSLPGSTVRRASGVLRDGLLSAGHQSPSCKRPDSIALGSSKRSPPSTSLGGIAAEGAAADGGATAGSGAAGGATAGGAVVGGVMGGVAVASSTAVGDSGAVAGSVVGSTVGAIVSEGDTAGGAAMEELASLRQKLVELEEENKALKGEMMKHRSAIQHKESGGTAGHFLMAIALHVVWWLRLWSVEWCPEDGAGSAPDT